MEGAITTCHRTSGWLVWMRSDGFDEEAMGFFDSLRVSRWVVVARGVEEGNA